MKIGIWVESFIGDLFYTDLWGCLAMNSKNESIPDNLANTVISVVVPTFEGRTDDEQFDQNSDNSSQRRRSNLLVDTT